MSADKTKLAVAAAAAAAAAAYYLYRRRCAGAGESPTILRSAYQKSQYEIETVDLNFVLTEEEAVVESKIKFTYTGTAATPPPLYLDGEDLTLRSIAMNGKELVKVRAAPARPRRPRAPGVCTLRLTSAACPVSAVSSRACAGP